MKKRQVPLAVWIFVGLIVGIAAGLILIPVELGGMTGLDIAKTYIKPFGTIFLNLLKFVVVPIVLFSIASGVISMQDVRKVGSVGGKTVVYYMCTTAFAVLLALILSTVARGAGLFKTLSTAGLTYAPPAGQSLMDTIVAIFPSNPITPMANATKLQVMDMTKRLLHMEKVARPDDAADAIAVALCHARSATSLLHGIK